ncbi:MAG: hypothetical protein ACSHW0_02865 [Thalassotalea sp.]
MKDFFEGSTDPIAIEASRLLATRQFVKSAILTRLLTYLVTCTLKNEVPKEISIGVEVFDKDTNYDPANDSLVRVYIHKLRSKIDAIYQAQDKHEKLRLSIPKGGYQVILEPFNDAAKNDERISFTNLINISERTWLSIGLSFFLFVSIAMHLVQYINKPKLSDTASQLWSDFAQNGKKTYIVLGDLYLFHYRESSSDTRLLARNTQVNSDQALHKWLAENPQNSGKITPTSNRFLMQSSAYTLKKITDMLDKNTVQYTITTLSDLAPKALRDVNIIYLGMYKSMGLLNNYFEKSNYICEGECYNTLIDHNGTRYKTFGAVDGEHIDYGMAVKMTRDNGAHALFLAGFSDTGIMQATRAVTNEESIKLLQQALSTENILLEDDFDVLFEVNGYDYSDYESHIKQVAKLPKERAF